MKPSPRLVPAAFAIVGLLLSALTSGPAAAQSPEDIYLSCIDPSIPTTSSAREQLLHVNPRLEVWQWFDRSRQDWGPNLCPAASSLSFTRRCAFTNGKLMLIEREHINEQIDRYSGAWELATKGWGATLDSPGTLKHIGTCSITTNPVTRRQF